MGAAFFVAMAGAPASASVIFTFTGNDFSDTTDNTGGSLTVTITDIAGGVELAFQNNFVDAGAFPGAFYFNTTFAPLTNAAGSCVLCGSIGAPSFSFGSNAFKADGDGKYDILIDMDNAPPSDRLEPGESATMRILADNVGFNAASFLSLSAPDGGHGPFEAALHLQSLPQGGSDWLSASGTVTSAPEPGSMLLFATALIGGARRLTRKS
jgi:hypothetical protein